MIMFKILIGVAVTQDFMVKQVKEKGIGLDIGGVGGYLYLIEILQKW